MNWYLILKGLYERDKIDIERLNKAVEQGLITSEEKQEILKP